MKRYLLIPMISCIAVFFAVTSHAADVGISISVAQPGFFGRIVLDSFHRPEVINRTPVIIGKPRHPLAGRPLYLRVPPHHRLNWAKYYAKYNAHGRPVYFVTERWYHKAYAQSHKGQFKNKHQFHERDKNRSNGRWRDGRSRYDKRRNDRNHHGKERGGRGHGR